MARFSQQSPTFDFFPHSTPSLDSKPLFPRDDEMNVLDDKILDSSNSHDVSAVNGTRRSSYDQSPDEFSRRDSIWSTDAHSRHTSQMSTPLFEPVNNPFVRLDNQTPSYIQQQQQQQQQHWPLSASSGSCTPTPIYENFPQEYDGAAPNPFTGGAVGPAQTISYGQVPLRTSPTFAPANSLPMSPQSTQGWISGSSEIQESQSKPIRNSAYRSTSNLTIRRDGIRKKNARFDIPAERTLSNIDILISQSNDEDEIKELKQQKRLLRNRQAALDSRQRKKVHTEQLEEDKRQSSALIKQLQEALQEMKLRESESDREKNELLEHQQQMRQYIEQLQFEKEELIRAHTLDTGNLRKKNAMLREEMEKMEMNAQSSGPNSGFRSNFSDYGSLAMDNNSWEPFSLADEFTLNTEHRPMDRAPTPTPANPLNLGFKEPEKATEKSSSDSGFSWNAFYMCLLFGAFVASNSGPAASSGIPALSEEYRAESANVLRAVLASASPADAEKPLNAGGIIGPSSAASAALPTTISGSEMAQMTSAPTLDSLHQDLVAPTKEQQQEEAFAMTTERYRALTTLEEDDGVEHEPPPSNLQQAYAAMRNNGLQNRGGIKGNSDVYSRSLLWDRVPEKVLRDFRNMVKDCGAPGIKVESGEPMCTS